MLNIGYGRLLGRIKELGLTQKAVAAAIGVSKSHFCRKIAGEYAFNQSEICSICTLLHIEPDKIGEYFFTPKVEKNQLSERRRLHD